MAQAMDAATASMIRNLEEKTGKTLEQWVKIAGKSGGQRHGEVVKYLKEEHGLTHGYANLVAHSAIGVRSAGAPEGEDLVAAQFSGDKAELRPIYDKLAKEIRKFGKDVELAPKKTYVSVRRSKQFAILQPSTKARFDVGINLRGAVPKGRLEASGSFNAMVSHRVRVESAAEVDAQLIGWLREAYEKA